MCIQMSPFCKKYQIYYFSKFVELWHVSICISRSCVWSFYSYIVYTDWFKINGSNLNVNFKISFKTRNIKREYTYTYIYYLSLETLKEIDVKMMKNSAIKIYFAYSETLRILFVAAIERRSFATSTEHQSGKFDGSRTPSSRRIPSCTASHRPNHIGCS